MNQNNYQLNSFTRGLLWANWWKYLCILLMFYTVIGGLLFPVPRLDILNETIRNIHFHVPMWFAMMIILSFAFGYSIAYLKTNNKYYDIIASQAVNISVVYGFLGLATGSLWAKFTWNDWWNNDPRQSTAAVAVLIYLAYVVLRSSIEDEDKRAKVAAVYKIFAFFAFIPLIWVVPRLTASLHPGSGGNNPLGDLDLNSQIRIVFYPAIFGWTLLGLWIASLKIRFQLLERKVLKLD